MILLSAERLSKQYPEQPLFEDLTFGIFKGNKMALVANNGAGKSSLIKILAGMEDADGGQITVMDSVRLGYLPQDPAYEPHASIQDCIDQAHGEVLNVIKSYYHALEQEDPTALASASAQMDLFNAWDYDRDLKAYLTRFAIHDTSMKILSLSGGQQKRLALALALADRPDLLIMDEPTNHLDIEMIEWLEKHLAQASITLFMVTHDRYFLDTVCNQILELSDGKLYRHDGNYAYFLEKKAEREMVFDKSIEKANKLLKQELEWMRRMPQARTTKAKSRIDAFYALEDQVAGKRTKDRLALDVKMSRVGGKILELKVIRKSYGDLNLIDGFSYTFKKGDRVGIVGANGVGKSTLLNIMIGNEKPDSGKVNVGQTTVFGHYSQQGITINPNERIIDVLKNVAENIVMANGQKVSASQFLTHFMFPPKMQYKPVEKLSGGEQRRLHLLTVLIKNPNFLILDEPTNDLDLLTLNKLEEFLHAYRGCLILVSHDRYFMDKLVDHLFIFEGSGKIRGFNGTYTEYRLKKGEVQKKSNPSKAIESSSTTVESARQRPSKKQKNEFRKLEREIEALELQKSEIEHFLSQSDLNLVEIQEKSANMAVIMGADRDKNYPMDGVGRTL